MSELCIDASVENIYLRAQSHPETMSFSSWSFIISLPPRPVPSRDHEL
jgi:hypothetical protein